MEAEKSLGLIARIPNSNIKHTLIHNTIVQNLLGDRPTERSCCAWNNFWTFPLCISNQVYESKYTH